MQYIASADDPHTKQSRHKAQGLGTEMGRYNKKIGSHVAQIN